MTSLPGPSAPAGWYPDPDSGTMAQMRYWNGFEWTRHTSPVAFPPPASTAHIPQPMSAPLTTVPADETLIRRLSEYSRWSGILWIILGALQIIFVFSAIAGIWNVFAGITRIRMAGSIVRREATVPAAFEGMAGLIIIGVINLVLGGVVGVLLVGVDFFVRDQVLKNAPLFSSSPIGAKTGTEIAPVHGG